jgi:hypothetical protein
MPRLETVDLSHNDFVPTDIPDDLCLLQRLQRLFLVGCNLKGVVPDFLRMDDLHTICISENPRLGGQIPRALVAECERLEFSNCKQVGNEEGPAMWAPFIMGMSIAPEDVQRVLCTCGHLFSPSQLVDPPAPKYHDGWQGWVDWQEQWLAGLKKWRKKTIYIFLTESFQQQFLVSEMSTR